MGNVAKASSIYVEWIKDFSQFNEHFLKNYNEERDEGYFLENEVQYLKKLHELHDDLTFPPDIMKIEEVEKHRSEKKKAKNDSEKDFFKLMNGIVFGKTMEFVGKHRDIKISTTEKGVWINKKWIRWKNYDKIYWNKSKNL